MDFDGTFCTSQNNIVVHDPWVCHDIDPMLYLQNQGHSVYGQPEWQHSKENMCHLQNIATLLLTRIGDYQESVTTRQTDAQHSDPYEPVCFARHKNDNMLKVFTATLYSDKAKKKKICLFPVTRPTL